MIETRNPFTIQTTEQIESDIVFLRLFSSGVLTLFSNKNVWDRVSLILSSPGGGKSSILRLFTPGSLLELHNHRNIDDYKELFFSMNQLGAIDDEGPQVLGVLISCVKNYDSLEDLKLDKLHKKRLFFALLDSRIIIAALRGISELYRIKYPQELKKITYHIPDELSDSSHLPDDFPINGNGEDLFNWAKKTEKEIYKIINSFKPNYKEALIGHNRILSSFILNPKYFFYDGDPIPPHVLIMLDDCQKLTPDQRDSLYEIIDQRPPIGIWLAERLDQFSTDQLIIKGIKDGRDVNFIELEEYWSQSNKKFEKIAINIADKRVIFSSTVDIQSFASRLQDECSESDQLNIEESIKEIENKILQKGKIADNYRERIETLKTSKEKPFNRAISWRTLEILIERDLKKEQKMLFDFTEDNSIPYDEATLLEREKSDVRGAAELFLARDFKLPYYYGISRLVKISSSNISQFLWLSGNIFEEIIAQSLVDPSKQTSLKKQEKIIRKTVVDRWEQIPYRVQYGREVQKFLTNIGKLCIKETYTPNAWNAPGVTGFAINMDELERVNDDTKYKKLNEIIRECLAYKLLEARRGQKCKGKEWMVLYLNRMLCVYFNLPLNYGGFKEKKLDDVLKWLEG